jgi:hypothetical protein
MKLAERLLQESLGKEEKMEVYGFGRVTLQPITDGVLLRNFIRRKEEKL